jgi:protein phosphatase
VKAALASGGEDNVTVVVIDVLAGDAEPNEEKKESGPFSGQILFGPSDRGAMVAASVHRAGRAVGGVRDRLSRKTPPVVRPVAGRGDRAATDDSSSYTDAPVAGPPFAGAPLAVPLAEITAEEPGPDSAPHSAQPAGTQPDEAPVTMATGSENLVETPATADEARQPVPMPKAKAGASRLLRGKRGKWFFLALAVVLILVIIVAAFAIYNSSVYYVGTYADGTVALYRGLPHSVLGIELSYAIQLGTVKYDALAPPQQQQVDAHDLVSKEEGQALLQSLVP